MVWDVFPQAFPRASPERGIRVLWWGHFECFLEHLVHLVGRGFSVVHIVETIFRSLGFGPFMADPLPLPFLSSVLSERTGPRGGGLGKGEGPCEVCKKGLCLLCCHVGGKSGRCSVGGGMWGLVIEGMGCRGIFG